SAASPSVASPSAASPSAASSSATAPSSASPSAASPSAASPFAASPSAASSPSAFSDDFSASSAFCGSHAIRPKPRTINRIQNLFMVAPLCGRNPSAVHSGAPSVTCSKQATFQSRLSESTQNRMPSSATSPHQRTIASSTLSKGSAVSNRAAA